MGNGVLFDQVHVSGGDAAAGIYIVAEVVDRDRLEGLLLTKIGVATATTPLALTSPINTLNDPETLVAKLPARVGDVR